MWSTITLLLLMVGTSSTLELVADPPSVIGQKFLDRVKRSLQTKDVAVINGLFNPKFEFTDCDGTYNKQQIVAFLMKIPDASKVSSHLVSAQLHGTNQIKLKVKMTGFEALSIDAVFTMNNADQQLVKGWVASCQKKFAEGNGESSFFK